jgi:RimJ/RimL family protein N-acetyltransferase
MPGVYRRPLMGVRTTLTDAWPLFGLRLRTERLVLRLPTDDHLVHVLALARAGIHPPDEMPFGVAWSTIPSPVFERSFMQYHWSMRGLWSPPKWSLNLVALFDGDPIGSQGIDAEAFAVHRMVSTGSWLGQAFQGRGFGTEMRAAVLGFAFDGLGARVAQSSAFLDNAASNAVSRKLGYEPNGFGSLAPEGVARATQLFRMTDEGWRSRPRPALTIEGLEACREMFGA